MMSVGNISEKLIVAANQNARERNYWLNRLAGKPVKKGFPHDYKKSGTNEYHMRPLSFVLGEELSAKLMETTRASDQALNLVLISGLTLLLNKYTGCKDIMIGTPIYKQEIEGDFINTVLVLRNTINNNITFKELLSRVRQTILEGTRHQNYPIELLIKELNIDPDTDSVEDGDSLFDVAILLENIHDKKYLDHIRCNMIFVFKREERQIRGIVEYNSRLYEKASIENIMAHFERLLDNALFHAHLPLPDLEMLTEKEKNQLLYDFNQTSVEYPNKKSILQWFAGQVEKTSNHIAVSSPIDLNDIYDQLESETVKPDLAQEMEILCFKKNSYIYQSPLTLPHENGNTHLNILKTRHHNSLIVNHQVVQLLDMFAGRSNLRVLHSWLKGLIDVKEGPVEFLIYSMRRGDLLEISFEFDHTPEIFSLDPATNRFEDFLHLVKSLYHHHLIELVGVETKDSKVEIPIDNYFSRDEASKLPGTNPLETLLIKDKEISTAPVLLLGDTPGTATTGLLYLGSYLKRNGINTYCQFYDPARDYIAMKENIEELLGKIQPAVVAISLKWFLYISRVMDMCHIIKEYARENSLHIKVVVGGNTASYYWEEIIEHDCIDYLIRGDGEEPLLKICRGEDEINISNCVYKKNGEVFENPIRYIQDETNSSEIYLSHLDEIMLSNHAARFGTFFIYAHKGCAMNCLYCGGCNQAQQRNFNRKQVFKRGVEEVRKDLLAARKYASTFQFEFDIPDENLREYCQQVWEGIDLSGHFCIFSTLTPPSSVLIELLSRTFKYVYWDFDICTPSQRHRKQLFSLGLVKPQPTDEEILNFMAQCERYHNIEVRLNLITGLPYFTPEDIDAGETFLSKIINRYSCFGELHWARLHAQPGAPIVENAGKHHMHTLASGFEDFLQYSKENFNHTAGYVAVEDFNYPYIYFKDDQFNSRVTNFYLEINKKIDQLHKYRQRGLIVNKALTYRELDEQTGQLAEVLKAKGVKPGGIVGLMLQRSLEIPVGIIGIMKAGCAYMPIDPEFPAGRIQYMLKDSNAKVLVSGVNEVSGLSGWHGEILQIPNRLHLLGRRFPRTEFPGKSPLERGASSLSFKSAGGGGVCPNLQSETNPSNLAYVIYTSGTTGKPKGVVLEQRNLVNYVHWFSAAASLSPGDKTVLTSSFAFDLGYTSIYTSLLNGGELHILSREIYLLAERLLDYIRQKRITYIKMTPSLFSAIVNSSNFSAESCETLRVAAIGGEAINVKDIEKAHSLCSHLQIMNHYGPTEATIGCVATFVDFERFQEYKAHPVIGSPIDNMQVYILDGDQSILPVGVPGELCIAGDGLAKGYLNRPPLTAGKFIKIEVKVEVEVEKEKKPFGQPMQSCYHASLQYHSQYPITPIPHHPIYRTGDLARWRPDGTIEFLGRVDNQVKIRGYRIELGEIENRLLKHHQVKEAVVAIKEISKIKGAAENDDKFLCAYFVPQKGAVGTITANTSDDNELLTLKDILEKENLDTPPDDYLPFKIEETEQSIVTLFKDKVKKFPDKIALESDGRLLTYQSLDDYSNRVARKILQEYEDRYKLSKNERIRYKRQLLLHGWGLASQEKLKATTVFVAGAGGGASPTIMQLALSGFGTIVICDCDVVELSNLNRQFLHDESRIGMNKALSSKMTIKRINPHVNVIALTQKLIRENAFELVGDADIILDMFDNLQDKFVLSQCAAGKGIPHIISAMTDINGYTVVFHPPATPCFHCIFDKKKLEEIVEGMGQYVEKYEKNPLPVAASSLFMSTGFAVNEAIKIVLGFETPAYNKFIFFNQRGTEKLAITESFKAMTYTFSDHFRRLCKQQGFDWDIGWRGNFLEELTIEPDPDCPVCSGKGEKTIKYLENQAKIINETTKPIEVKEEQDNSKNTQNTALLLNHGMNMAAGLLGILKAGKTYVPLDPDSSMERLAFILEDSESRIILTDDDHFDKVKTLRDQFNKNIKIINIGRVEPSNVNEKGEIEIQTNQAAYVLYPPHTYKTTGAVIETQKSILEFLRTYNYNLQLTGKQSLQPHSIYSFNAGMIDLFAALLNGTGAYVFNRNKNKKEIINPGRDSFSSKLREYLVEALPDYMIPSFFVQLEKIPITPNGKVDKKALPTPAIGTENGLHPVHKPRNEIEEKLARIWSEVLGIEKDEIGIDSNFFKLGGHSLNAAIMVAKIHKELNVKLPLGKVFIVPTLRGLAEITKTEEEDIYDLIRPIEEREYYPMSSAQLRLFLLNQIKTDITSDNISGVFSLDGSLEVQRIEDIFNQLIKRHEVFRTSFETVDYQPVQRVHRTVSFKIIYIEPGKVTSRLTDQEISNIINNFIRPFDLSRAPLLRVGLLKLVEQKHLIMYDMHHIISDGTSFPILENEFISLYGGGQLPRLRIQYKDFTSWQNNLMKSNAFKKQEEYWLDLFSTEIPELNLPTDYPREGLQSFEGDFVNFMLDKNLTARIYKIAEEVGATLYMALLAIYNILLYKYTGQEDIVVGSSAAGRPHVDLQNVLGFFVNTLALRNYPKGEKTFREFLTEVKSNALKAYENQDYQFDELVKRLGIQRDASRQVLFDTHFTLHKIFVENNPDVSIEDVTLDRYPFEDKTTQFDIIFHANEIEQSVRFSVGYSTKLFKKKTIERFLDYYKEIAQTVADNKNIKLKDIKISHHLEAAQANMPQADFVF